MMANSELIVDLYSVVFRKQKDQFDVSKYEIMNGMGEIGEAYSPDPYWEYKGDSPCYYYEDAAHRCAYLHKYAMIHTGLLCDLLEQALKVYAIKEVLDKGTDGLNLCSLGSGPGTDILACLLVLKEHFGTYPIKATLIDCCEGWQFVFEEIVSQLESISYVSDMPYTEEFDYEYIDADLLDFDDYDFEVTPAIKHADVVTMVKFVSAAACRDTRQMVKTIFRVMKPGALLLFVDNAAGGFHEMMSQTAEECGMKSVFEPLRHYHYEEENFCHVYCNLISQFETRVAVEVWKKTETSPWNTTHELRRQFFHRTRHLGATFTDEDFPVLQPSEYRPIVIKETIQRQRVKTLLPVVQPESTSETKNNQKCCTHNLDETFTNKDFPVLQSGRCRNRRNKASRNRRDRASKNKCDRASKNRRDRASKMTETIERQRIETPLPVAQPESTSETKNNQKCCTHNLDKTSTDKDFPVLQSRGYRPGSVSKTEKNQNCCTRNLNETFTNKDFPVRQSSRPGGCKLIIKEEVVHTRETPTFDKRSVMSSSAHALWKKSGRWKKILSKPDFKRFAHSHPLATFVITIIIIFIFFLLF